MPAADSLVSDSWPDKFYETDGWAGYEADAKKTKLRRGATGFPQETSLGGYSDAAGNDGSDQGKWWHVSDQQIENLVEELGRRQPDSLDEMLHRPARGTPLSAAFSASENDWSKQRLEASGDRSKDFSSRRNQLEPFTRTGTFTGALKSPRRIKLNIQFVDTGDAIELMVPPGLQIAPARPTALVSPRAPSLAAPAHDRAGRALRALLWEEWAPPIAAANQQLPDREKCQSLKGILAQLIDVDTENILLFSGGVPLLGGNNSTVQASGIRDRDTLSVHLKRARGAHAPPLTDVLSQSLHRAATWHVKLKPRWRWDVRPNLIQPVGTGSNKHSPHSPRAFADYGPYLPDEYDTRLGRVRTTFYNTASTWRQ